MPTPETEIKDAAASQPDGESTGKTESQTVPPINALPDDEQTQKAKEVEKLKTEYASIVKEVEEIKTANAALEKRLKDNQEYISRTRNAAKDTESSHPQKTLDEYLEDVAKKFEDDPKEGLKKVIRDIAYDRDLERADYERRLALAEERAFRKTLALNPESSKMLKEIEKLDEECPDLAGLSFERKAEFIKLRSSNATQLKSAVRDRLDHEINVAGEVGAPRAGQSREKVPAWVSDPEVVPFLAGRFSTKQEALAYADPEQAREIYLQKIAAQRKA